MGTLRAGKEKFYLGGLGEARQGKGRTPTRKHSGLGASSDCGERGLPVLQMGTEAGPAAVSGGYVDTGPA